MITIKDCEAFCDANPDWVQELACRECLGMVQAYAQAHEIAVCDKYFNPSADRADTRSNGAVRPIGA